MPQTLRLSPATMATLSTLAANLSNNKDTRAPFAHLVAKVDPELAKSFNDVFLSDKFAALEKKIDDGIQTRQANELQQAQQRQRQKLIDDGRYTEDQVKEIESGVMTKFGLSDYEAGATLYAAEHPPEHPALAVPDFLNDNGQTWEFPTVVGRDGKNVPFNEFQKDPRKHSLNSAIYHIQQFKRNSLPAAFHR